MFLPRLVPAAITPLRLEHIATAWFKERGMEPDAFNKDLASYFDASEAYTFTSLMRTVYASLFPLKRAHGRKYVILPRYSCPSFAHGILANNLQIRYVDQDPKTLSYEMTDLKRKMDEDVLAIIVPHFFGLAHPIDDICTLARSVSCIVIEGVDYSIGAVYKGKRLGTFGDIGILNFQEGKAIPIGGGALFVRNKKLLPHFLQYKDAYRPMSKGTILRSIAFAYAIRPFMYYFVRKLFALLKRDVKNVSFEDTIRETQDEYDFEFTQGEPLYQLSHFQKSLGRELLQMMPRHQEIRNRNAAHLQELLKGSKHVHPVEIAPALDMPHFIRFPVFAADAKDRNLLIQTLFTEGVEASSMYTDHGMQIDGTQFPGSKKIYDTLITLPVHPYCTEADMQKTAHVVSSFQNV